MPDLQAPEVDVEDAVYGALFAGQEEIDPEYIPQLSIAIPRKGLGNYAAFKTPHADEKCSLGEINCQTGDRTAHVLHDYIPALPKPGTTFSGIVFEKGVPSRVDIVVIAMDQNQVDAVCGGITTRTTISATVTTNNAIDDPETK